MQTTPEESKISISDAELDRLLELVAKKYPGWNGFDHAEFVKEEVDYKRAAAAKAQDLLSHDQLSRLISEDDFAEIISRIEAVGKATNLLFLSVPQQGDLGILFHPNLDKPAFCREFVYLLHGKDDLPSRLDSYLAWVAEQRLPSKWTFPTYFLFLCHPESEIFVKPSVTSDIVRRFGITVNYSGPPTVEKYQLFCELAGQLKTALKEYDPKDFINIQSLLYVSWKQEHEQLVSDSRLEQFQGLFEKFSNTYPSTPDGKVHIELQDRSRRDAQSNLEAIRTAKEKGEEITDLVLNGLLPHANTEANRERGAWITFAPAINKDIRSFFEGAGLTEAHDWPKVANAVFDFVVNCLEAPGELVRLSKNFSELPYTKGLQTGMLTPILNALQPEDFALINSKSRKVLNLLANRSLGLKLSDYPQANALFSSVVEELDPIISNSGLSPLLPGDIFDMFCHWLVAVEKFNFKERYWKVSPGQRARLWQDWLEGGYASIGWNELGDVTDLKKSDFNSRLERLLPDHPDWTKRGVAQAWKFARIKEGDRLIANQGTEKVLGIGTVAGDYYYVEGREHAHRLPVEWDDLTQRAVAEKGWKKTLVQLEREDFDRIVAAPVVAGDTTFSQSTFDLLTELHATPTKDYYATNKENFKEHLEEPFKGLLLEVVNRLPKAIVDFMETEKNLFSRIPKNDWGRGGAWDAYWGALYPKGERRTAAAQLFVWINKDRFGFGFYIGEYGTSARDLFLRNVKKHGAFLAEHLADSLSDPGLLFGDLSELEDPTRRPAKQGPGITWREWLREPGMSAIRAECRLSRDECLATSKAELIKRIAEIFERQFPLVLLASSDDPIPDIERYLGIEPLNGEVQPEYPLATVAADTGFSQELLSSWVRAVDRKGQAIIYGPPGTGKTFVAEKLADHLIGGGNGFKELVQFHPSYAYEDFIQGIRPDTTEGGQLTFDTVKGRFWDFCVEARRRLKAEAPHSACVLIIDEINRANLSRVFGELMYLLEYRDRDMPMAGGGRLQIPDNVRIIGTMNTADRSIALVDHALRRRFAFLALRPEPNVLQMYHERNDTSFDTEGLIETLRLLNLEIADPNYAVGITFFLRSDLTSQIEDIWRMEIEPYLEEYFFDQHEKTDKFRWEKVKERVLG